MSIELGFGTQLSMMDARLQKTTIEQRSAHRFSVMRNDDCQLFIGRRGYQLVDVSIGGASVCVDRVYYRSHVLPGLKMQLAEHAFHIGEAVVSNMRIHAKTGLPIYGLRFTPGKHNFFRFTHSLSTLMQSDTQQWSGRSLIKQNGHGLWDRLEPLKPSSPPPVTQSVPVVADSKLADPDDRLLRMLRFLKRMANDNSVTDAHFMMTAIDTGNLYVNKYQLNDAFMVQLYQWSFEEEITPAQYRQKAHRLFFG